MTNNLKHALVNLLTEAGAYQVGIADPRVGFEHAPEGCHPLELWEQCKSLVVFAVARSPKVNNTYAGPYAPWQGKRALGPIPRHIQTDGYAMRRLSQLFIAPIWLTGAAFLHENGYSFSFRRPRLKLAAFEAGIGVYGRSGVLVHPVLGNRMALSAIMTDAVLGPDGRLEGFEPCQDCDLCIEMCPAEAYDPAESYPHSWSRKTCTSKRAEIEKDGLYCHNCFAVCPAGELKDEDLLCIKEAKSFFASSTDERDRP
jgi:epoxyqueuosine reductase QueG